MTSSQWPHASTGSVFLMAVTCILAVTDARELLSSTKSGKPPFTLVVIGDSTSDTGNIFNKTGNYPTPGLYWNGRYSNGPNWVDYLGEALKSKFKVNVVNYAHGGSTTCPATTGVFAGLPYILDAHNQTALFLEQLSSGELKLPKGGKVLAVEWSVNNDILSLLYNSGSAQAPPITTVLKFISDVVACRMDVVMRLAQSGVVNDIIMPGTGSLAYIPLVPLELRDSMQQLLDAMDAATAKAVDQLQATFDAAPADSPLFGVNVWMAVNSHDFTRGVLELGFKVVGQPCLVTNSIFKPSEVIDTPTICTNPEDYFSWDYLHPTTRYFEWAAKELLIPKLQMLHILPAGL